VSILECEELLESPEAQEINITEELAKFEESSP
jgi:hypothetical protein